MIYHPDKWALIKVKDKNESFYKILSAWKGSYVNADSWRLNSGITSYGYKENHYIFESESGSLYVCDETRQGLTVLSYSILQQLKERFKDRIEYIPNELFETVLINIPYNKDLNYVD